MNQLTSKSGINCRKWLQTAVVIALLSVVDVTTVLEVALGLADLLLVTGNTPAGCSRFVIRTSLVALVSAGFVALNQ